MTLTLSSKEIKITVKQIYKAFIASWVSTWEFLKSVTCIVSSCCFLLCLLFLEMTTMLPAIPMITTATTIRMIINLVCEGDDNGEEGVGVVVGVGEELGEGGESNIRSVGRITLSAGLPYVVIGLT